MARVERCAACKFVVPADATFCPGCGRNIAKDGRASAVDLFIDDEAAGGGSVVSVGGRDRGRRELAIIGGAIIIVFILVATVGRSRDKTIATPPTTTLAPITTTTVVSRTTTTVPATTTTVAAVHVYGPLLPEKTGVTLLVSQLSGGLVQVDVDSGTVTDLLPGQDVGSLFQLFALRHGVVGLGANGARLVADGKVSTLGTVDQMMGSTDGIHVIGMAYTETARLLVSFVPGGRRDPTIQIPNQTDAVALLTDAVVLQSRAGGVYALDVTGGIRKIADGNFVAAAGNRVASVTCDSTLQCRVGVGPVGERPTHQVALGVTPDAFSGQYGSALSPTRDQLAYETTFHGSSAVVVYDLAADSAVLVSGVMSDTRGQLVPLVWSADGRWLFWVDSGQVNAWSPDRGGAPIQFARAQTGTAELIAAGYSG